MGRATSELLDMLHAELAQTMLGELKRQKNSEDGVQASTLSAIAKFLKDNHIEANLGEGDTDELERKLGLLGGLPYDGEVPDEYKQ